MTGTATVYLVGAGPGDIGLMTMRALDLLRRADIVIYDYLVNPALLAEAPAHAKLVPVGKRGFSCHATQGEINDLLINAARELTKHGDGIIVRLKGGDPFLFGRGGEEALACRREGIPFEVIPGVTSGIAAPAYAGIPVTHRGLASSVTFVTGHEDPSKPGSAINWPALSQLALGGSTICFYMGMHDLDRICAHLSQNGLPASHPMAIVQWGTTSKQRTLTTTLNSAAADRQRAGIGAPAIIVVGAVSQLHADLRWFEDKPLFGKTIVNCRPTTQSHGFSKKLRELGANVVEFPAIEISEPDDPADLEQALAHVSDYDWIVFTSANGVNAFFSRLAGDARMLARAKVAAIGPETAKSLHYRGIKPDVVPQAFRAESLFEAMKDHASSTGHSLYGASVLIARAQEARKTLPTLLRQAGANVDVVAAYKCIAPKCSEIDDLASMLEAGAVFGIAFTSPSTARNMATMLGTRMHLLERAALFAIGPITGSAIRGLGFENVIEADEYTAAGLTDIISRSAS